MRDLVQLINREFERTVPIIHKEGENDYAIIQRTDSGIVRIMARTNSQQTARQIVNRFILNMPQKKKHPTN